LEEDKNLKQDRFLIGILLGIGILVVVAVGTFFLRQVELDYVDETTPDGVVHNFFFAIHQGDYERAYGYLADEEGKPSLTEFRSNLSREYDRPFIAGVEITGYDVIQNEDGSRGAVVDLVVSHASNGPFDTGYHSNESAILVEQDGHWKIKEMPFWYWWNWYPIRSPEE
jgi:hypothetical protein